MSSGVVQSVTPVRAGGTLTAAVDELDTVLLIDDAAEFDEDFDQPRYLVIGDDLTPREYVAVANDEDAQESVTLADPVGVDVELGTHVTLWDPTVEVDDKRAVRYVAWVLPDEDEGRSVPATIPHTMVPLAGVYTLEGASVRIAEDDDEEWFIAEVFGRPATIDGATIDPDTLPAMPPADPELPSVSPTPVVTNGPNALIVEFDYIPGVTYDLHLTTVDPGTDDPDVTTLHTERFLPGLWVRNDADGNPLALGEEVWVAIVARTATGGAADPSPWVTGMPRVIPESNLEIVAGNVIAERLQGETVQGVNLSGVVLDILDALHAEPGFLDILATVFRARQAVFDDNVDVRGLNNVLRGRLVAGAGVSDPTGGPTVFASYDSQTTGIDDPIVPPELWYGMTPNPIAATQAVSAFSFVGGGGLRSHILTTGVREPLYFVDFADFYPTGGVTTIGGHLYVLGVDGTVAVDAWRVRKYNGTTLAFMAEWDPGINPSARPVIGTDGTNVLVAFARPTGDLFRVRTFTAAGVVVGTFLDVPHSLSSVPDLGAVAQGSFNLGATRVVVVPETADPHVYTTAGVRDTTREFPRANGARVRGLHWDGTRFRHVDRTGKFWRYSLHAGASLSATYTLVDGDAGGAGLAESLPSDATVITIPRGAWINVQTPPPPDLGGVDDPDRVNVYLDNKRPSGGQYVAGTLLGTFDQVPGSGTAAPVVSGFAGRVATAIGSYESASGESYVRGDDTARLPGLVQAGSLSTGTLVANTDKDIAVVFPEPFPVAPKVTLTPEDMANLNNPPSYTAVGVTTTGFTMRVRRGTTASFLMGWTAVRPT